MKKTSAKPLVIVIATISIILFICYFAFVATTSDQQASTDTEDTGPLAADESSSDLLEVTQELVLTSTPTATLMPTATATATSTSTPTLIPTNTPIPTNTFTPIPIASPTAELISYTYEEVTERSGATSFIFDSGSSPPLLLGPNNEIVDVESLNDALSYLNLPTVTEPIQERASITGHRFHRGQYYWEDYPIGPLTVHRSTCTTRGQRHDCIWKITIAFTEE